MRKLITMLIFALSISIVTRAGTLDFDYATEVRVESDFKKLTDLAELKFPSNLALKGQSLKELIQRGDQVTISAGYLPELNLEFTGYVVDVLPDATFTIKCEDQMFLLKSMPSIIEGEQNAWRQQTLDGLLKRLLKGKVPHEALDMNLGAYRLTEKTVALELLKLKERYGLYSYFRDGVLKVGFGYDLDESQTVDFGLTGQKGNVPSEAIDLEYRLSERSKVKVKAVIMKQDGTQETVEIGDSDGEVHTLHYNYTEASRDSIRKVVEADLAKLKYTGYRGGFKAYGAPFCKHGYTVRLTDDNYPERQGSYAIDKTLMSITPSGGYRRYITLGRRL